MRYYKDEFEDLVKQAVPAGQEEHTPEEHRRRVFHQQRIMDGRREAALKYHDLITLLLEAEVVLGKRTAYEEVYGSHERARAYRECARMLRSIRRHRSLGASDD